MLIEQVESNIYVLRDDKILGGTKKAILDEVMNPNYESYVYDIMVLLWFVNYLYFNFINHHTIITESHILTSYHKQIYVVININFFFGMLLPFRKVKLIRSNF